MKKLEHRVKTNSVRRLINNVILILNYQYYKVNIIFIYKHATSYGMKIRIKTNIVIYRTEANILIVKYQNNIIDQYRITLFTISKINN